MCPPSVAAQSQRVGWRLGVNSRLRCHTTGSQCARVWNVALPDYTGHAGPGLRTPLLPRAPRPAPPRRRPTARPCEAQQRCPGHAPARSARPAAGPRPRTEPPGRPRWRSHCGARRHRDIGAAAPEAPAGPGSAAALTKPPRIPGPCPSRTHRPWQPRPRPARGLRPSDGGLRPSCQAGTGRGGRLWAPPPGPGAGEGSAERGSGALGRGQPGRYRGRSPLSPPVPTPAFPSP